MLEQEKKWWEMWQITYEGEDEATLKEIREEVSGVLEKIGGAMVFWLDEFSNNERLEEVLDSYGKLIWDYVIGVVFVKGERYNASGRLYHIVDDKAKVVRWRGEKNREKIMELVEALQALRAEAQ